MALQLADLAIFQMPGVAHLNGTATATVQHVALGIGAGNEWQPCQYLTFKNTGLASLEFSLDGGNNWALLLAGDFFDWDLPLFSVAIRRVTSDTTFQIVRSMNPRVWW